MKIDLFELIEGLIRGIVFFIYNVLETIGQLVRHPYRGPLRLHRAHHRAWKQQISGLTLLALVYFANFGFSPFVTSSDRDEPSWWNMVSAPPDFTAQSVWAVLVAGLAAIMIVDGPIRLALKLRHPRRMHRRQLILSLIHYSLFWPVIAIGVSMAWETATYGQGRIEDLVNKALFVLVLISLIPGGLALRRAWKRSGWFGRREGGWIRYLVGGAIGSALLFVLLATSFFAGTALRIEISGAVTADIDIAVDALRCDFQNAAEPRLDAVLTNRTGAPILFRPEQNLLFVYHSGTPADPAERMLSRIERVGLADPPAVLLEPGARHLLHAEPFLDRAALGSRQWCGLLGYGPEGFRVEEKRAKIRM